jgi:hypothetical protein
MNPTIEQAALAPDELVVHQRRDRVDRRVAISLTLEKTDLQCVGHAG